MMKKLSLLLLFSFSFLLFTSCDDDDDPTYEWRTLWINQTLDVDGNVIRTDTVADFIQKKSDADAKVVIECPASTFGVSNVVEDIIQSEGDVKTRTIIYNSRLNKIIYSKTKIK